MPDIPGKGLIKGLGVTFGEMVKTLKPDSRGGGPVTVDYPHVKEDPAPRARGVIALHEENCTSCMLCARECPDWCIYIEAHKYLAPPRREGGKPRQRQGGCEGAAGRGQTGSSENGKGARSKTKPLATLK